MRSQWYASRYRMGMVRSFIYIIVALSALFTAPVAMAGYTLTKAKLAILVEPRPLPCNQDIDFLTMIDRVQNRIDAVHGDLPILENHTQARIIAIASSNIGIDFGVLSSVIRRESKFCSDRSGVTGNGCMQFTSTTLKELKNQFGVNGIAQHGFSKSPQVLRRLVSSFFYGIPEREDAFYVWLKLPVPKMLAQIRTGENFDIDILSGALVLKIYLALANGNYTRALQNYNGAPSKGAYATAVAAQACRY